ncbi:Protein of unknown function DUF3987) [uncultured Caudovirales phage]|uniref:Uncharacterized protein n=1 Tax=uncultured Caudovirales phage TaxID=2100421 RepID=A0A6J5NG30_9CAUD|nr:Protein of unknown function DUF3987) [uncultured Caudovirales phage]
MSADDFADFEAGYNGAKFGAQPSQSYADDFSAEDFAPPAPEKPESNDRFPPPFSLDGIDLLTPPGFVGDVAAWIDSQCRYPRRRLAVASALTAIGNIGGLRHEDARDGVTANLLAFCVAASATGKEAVMQATTDLHIAAGVHYALQGGIKSEQEIIRNLIEHQPAYYIIDEIGIFLIKVRNAQRRGGAAYLESVFGAIMSGYSKANSRLMLNGDTKRELRKIYGSIAAKSEDDGREDQAARAKRMLKMVDEGLDRPFLSVVGFTTPGTFDQIMDGETATQGFVGRAIIVAETDNNPEERSKFRKRPMPEGLAMKLAQIFHGGNFDIMEAQGARVEYAGDRELVLTDPDASDMLEGISKWLHSYAEEMGENTGEASVAMIRRAYELIAKISFILAIPTARRTAEHVRWAFAYVRAELDAKIKLVFANDNGKDRPEEAIAARVINYIDPEKGASTRVLANRMKVKTEVLEPILAKMEAHAMIRRQDGQRKRAGKIPDIWMIV